VRRLAAVGFACTLVVLTACGGSGDGGSGAADGEAIREKIDPERVGPQGRVAQFVVQCTLSHAEYDDPIVYPDDPGMSHLHTFFGNRLVDADPDYGRVAGADTSCEQRKDTASYWAPALLDATGQMVEPLGVTAYYRPGFGVDPATVEPYPAGLMLIAGDRTSTEPQSTSIISWSCGTSAIRENTPRQCPISETLRLLVNFPDCWDGEHLGPEAAGAVTTATEDPTSSMGSMPHGHTGGAGAGVDVTPFSTYSESGSCPSSHPVPIPMLQLAIDYPPVDPEELSLASGSITTAHADFWNVWDQAKLEQEVELCLNADRVCGVTS
jgi:hypothetical protein